MNNLIKALSSNARMCYYAAVLSAFLSSFIIIVHAKWSGNGSPHTQAFVAVCGLMITLGSATQCIRLTLLDQEKKKSDSATNQ